MPYLNLLDYQWKDTEKTLYIYIYIYNPIPMNYLQLSNEIPVMISGEET